MKRIILISEGKIFLAPECPFPLSKTTFPLNSISFSSRVHQFWEVDATNDNGNLTFIVKNYHPVDSSDFDKQKINGPIILISFKELDWRELQKLLTSYSLVYIRRFLDSSTIDSLSLNTTNNNKHILSKSNLLVPPEKIEIIQTIEEIYEEEFQVSYEETIFNNGYVEFSKNFKWSPNSLLIKIYNSCIREEFEVIKGYFAKAINNRKRYSVKIKAKKTGFNSFEFLATSEDIEKINHTLIDNVRIATTKRLFSEYKELTSNKKVLSVEEIFTNIDYPNVFNQSDIDIFGILAETYGLRNKLPLEYLSGQIHSIKQKVKFTLKPMFGFLFFIEGTKQDFFCWELLNTNATYLWMIQKDTGDAMQIEIENEISVIHQIGRQLYRKRVKEAPLKNMQFFFIDHKGIRNENEGFADWKCRLLEIVNDMVIDRE